MDQGDDSKQTDPDRDLEAANDLPSPPLEEAAAPLQPTLPIRYALVLLLASILGSVLVVPYSWVLISQDRNHAIPKEMLPLVMAIEVAIETALSAVAVGVGLKLGVVGRLGLGWPPLDGWKVEPAAEGRRRRRAALAWGVGLGVVSTLIVVGIERSMRGQLEGGDDIVLPSWWISLLGSVGAGIREEVWLRLGFMTFIVWLGALINGRRPAGPWLLGLGNLVACLLFAAMHLPQAAVLLGLTPGIVLFVILANGLPGLLFGWLFARKGLLAAMVSHTVADILLKVVLPLVLN